MIGPRFARLRAHACRRCRTNDTAQAPFYAEVVILALTGRRRYRCRTCRRHFWSRPRRIPPPPMPGLA